MRLKLISCEIFYREMCFAVSCSRNQVDVTFLPKGLHDQGARAMRLALQLEVDRVDGTDYEAVLLGYGLCGNGICGLKARRLPLVVPRAHDCITLFLGSQSRYLRYFWDHPGTYFKTTGWIERGGDLQQLGAGEVQELAGVGMSYDDMVKKYGRENADYLLEQLGGYVSKYSRMTYINMGLKGEESFEMKTLQEAAQREMEFDRLEGDISLIQRLIDGEWDEEEFLFVPPGQEVTAEHDASLITLRRED